MNDYLITLIMGQKYLVNGMPMDGQVFTIGDAHPKSKEERLCNDHLSSATDFFKTNPPFKDDLAYQRLTKLNSIGFIAYYLADMGNIVILNVTKYNSTRDDYIIYVPSEIDIHQKSHILNFIKKSKSATFSLLYNLRLIENRVDGNTHVDISSSQALNILSKNF